MFTSHEMIYIKILAIITVKIISEIGFGTTSGTRSQHVFFITTEQFTFLLTKGDEISDLALVGIGLSSGSGLLHGSNPGLLYQ